MLQTLSPLVRIIRGFARSPTTGIKRRFDFCVRGSVAAGCANSAACTARSAVSRTPLSRQYRSSSALPNHQGRDDQSWPHAQDDLPSSTSISNPSFHTAYLGGTSYLLHQYQSSTHPSRKVAPHFVVEDDRPPFAGISFFPSPFAHCDATNEDLPSSPHHHFRRCTCPFAFAMGPPLNLRLRAALPLPPNATPLQPHPYHLILHTSL